jgi:hypothetical protein
MKKLLLVLALAYAAFWIIQNAPDLLQTPLPSTGAEQQLQTAFENRQSDLQVSGSGVVVAVLADDNQGSRHQRFILELSSGQTLLVSHNIDLAPRINSLRKGDTVEFFGEYEWNERGGVIHWTHHDPAGRHPDGWLQHRGKTYE